MFIKIGMLIIYELVCNGNGTSRMLEKINTCLPSAT